MAKSPDGLTKSGAPVSSSELNSAPSEIEVSKSIAVARAGSPAAMGQLLQHYREYLFRIAREELDSNLAPKVAQSDLVQDTCLQAARDFVGFVGDSEWELRVWLRQILLNNLRDAEKHYRVAAKRAVHREVSLQDHSDIANNLKAGEQTPSAVIVSGENRSAIIEVIRGLPADYRLAVELRSLEGRSFEEVGAALGRTAAAARKVWSRAVLKMAEELHRNG